VIYVLFRCINNDTNSRDNKGDIKLIFKDTYRQRWYRLYMYIHVFWWVFKAIKGDGCYTSWRFWTIQLFCKICLIAFKKEMGLKYVVSNFEMQWTCHRNRQLYSLRYMSPCTKLKDKHLTFCLFICFNVFKIH
jgi:hypothetical protein